MFSLLHWLRQSPTAYCSQPHAVLTPVQKRLSQQYSPDGFPQPDSDDDFANGSISVFRLLFDIAAENLKAHDDLPPSNFDYDEAMRSNVMDAIFEVLTKDSQPVEIDSAGHTLYAMDGNKDLLMSNPF